MKPTLKPKIVENNYQICSLPDSAEAESRPSNVSGAWMYNVDSRKSGPSPCEDNIFWMRKFKNQFFAKSKYSIRLKAG